MPKPKPDKVIRHEIVLGRTLQDTVNGLSGALQAQAVSKSYYNMTSDTTTVIVTIILYEMITGKDTGVLATIGGLLTGSLKGIVDGWQSYRQTAEYQQEYHERATSATGGLQNLFDQMIGALTGESVGSWLDEQS